MLRIIVLSFLFLGIANNSGATITTIGVKNFLNKYPLYLEADLVSVVYNKNDGGFSFSDPEEGFEFEKNSICFKGENKSPFGFSLKIRADITKKIFAEMSTVFVEGKERIYITSPQREYDLGEIKIKSSPEFSVNCLVWQGTNTTLYIGGGLRYLWLKGNHSFNYEGINEIYPSSGEGWKPSVRFVLKFPCKKVIFNFNWVYCPIGIVTEIDSVTRGSFKSSLGKSFYQMGIETPLEIKW